MLFDQAIAIPNCFKSDTLTVVLKDERARYSVRIKAQDLAAISKLSGVVFPKTIGGTSSVKDVLCACLGPDEWIVITDCANKGALDKAFAKASEDFICSITDISHRNVAFEISGAEASKLINVGCPLDLSVEAFPVGRAKRTVFESVTIMLYRSAEGSFHVECWRSFGPYLRDYFKRIISS